MPYIKFLNDIEPHKGKLERVSDNLVKVILEDDSQVNTSGFRTYRDYEMLTMLGNFEDFTTLYSDDFTLSNDGSTTLAIEVEQKVEATESVVALKPTLIASEVGSVSAFGNSSVINFKVEDSEQKELYVFLSHSSNNETDLKFELSGNAVKEYEVVKELRSASLKCTSNFLLIKVTTKGSGDISIHSSSQQAISTSNAMIFQLG